MPALVVEASGSSNGITTALSLVRPGGRCVIAGTTGRTTPVAFDTIVRNEIQILGGLGQSWDVEAAVKIIESERYPIHEMVACKYPLDKAADAITAFIERPQDFIRVGLSPA